MTEGSKQRQTELNRHLGRPGEAPTRENHHRSPGSPPQRATMQFRRYDALQSRNRRLTGQGRLATQTARGTHRPRRSVRLASALALCLSLFLAFCVPGLAIADSAQDQYTEPPPSPTGNKPKPRTENNSGGSGTSTGATPSSSEGTPGGAATTDGPSSNEEAKPRRGKGSTTGSDKRPQAEASQPRDTAGADRTTVAQVPDEAIVASTGGGDSGSSPLVWIGLGVAVLGAGSGLLVLRRRA